MRARKAERCLQRASAALDDGSILEASAALDEARQLSPDDPRFQQLSARLEALKQPAPATTRRYGWMGIVAAGCVLFAATSWQAWTHREQLSQLLLKPERPMEQADMSAGLAPPSSSSATIDPRNDAAGVPTSTTGTSQLTIQTTLIRPDTVTDARTEAVDSEAEDAEISSTPIAEENSRLNPRTDARSAFATLRSPEPVTPSQLDTPSLAVSESRPSAVVPAAPTSSTATNYIPSILPPPEPLRTFNPAAANNSPAETAAMPTPPPNPASAAASSSVVRDDRVAIRAALSRYEAAYNRLDVNAVRSVWPTLDQRALARAFDGLNAQRVSLQACNVDVTGNTARANCSGNASWTPKVGGGGERSAARKWTFDLSDSDEGWRIVHVQAR